MSRLALALIVSFPIVLGGCYQSYGREGGPCVVDGDCTPAPASCAAAVCIASSCQWIPVPDGCAPGETCDPTRGCVGSLDASIADVTSPTDVLDVGRDGGRPDTFPVPDAPRPDVPLPFDAGLDAPLPFDGGRRDAPLPFDAGRDAGRRDAGRADSGPPRDAPAPDAPRRDAGPRDAGPRDAGPGDTGPRDAGRDAGRVTSTARRCTAESVITIPDRTVLSTSETTLEMWVRIRGAGTIARKGDASGRHHFELVVEDRPSGPVLRAGWGTGTLSASVEVPIGDRFGIWSHLALTHAQGADGVWRMELFVDAVPLASVELPADIDAAFNSVPFTLCSFDGDIDEIRLWGGALSAAVIEARRFGPVAGSTGGLIAYWPLQGTGQVIFDRTLGGADGVAGEFSTVDPRDPAGIPDGAF